MLRSQLISLAPVSRRHKVAIMVTTAGRVVFEAGDSE